MRKHRQQRDRGAVLVIAALIMVVLLTIAALAVDLGQGRLSNRENQTASDLAALSAGYFLAGKGDRDSNGNAIANAKLACQAAINSVQTNLEGFEPTLNLTERQNECSSFLEDTADCDPTSPSTSTAVIERGPYTLTIQHPLSDGQISDTRLGGDGSGVNDGDDPCDRMLVEVEKTDATRFAGVIGVDTVSTSASAVVEGGIEESEKTTPAFLILERTRCNTISNSVGGSGSKGIVVRWNGDAGNPQPGLIHSDSNATHATECSGNENADGYAIWGKELSGGGPSITAEDVPDEHGAEKGIIQTTATNGRGAAQYPGGLSVQPTTADVVGRVVVDARYNTDDDPNTEAITTLHDDAYTELDKTGAPDGYEVVDCDGNTTTDGDESTVYVDCAQYKGDTVPTPGLIAGATTVVFSNDIGLGNNGELFLDAATEIVVRGQLAAPKGEFRAPVASDLFVGDGLVVGGNGTLSVNGTGTPDGDTDDDGATDDCANREDGDDWSNTTRLAIFGGGPALDVAGIAALCQTTVYLAGPNIDTNDEYTIQTETTGDGGSTPCDEISCPKTIANTATGARLLVQGTLTWVAPNQHTSGPVPEGEAQGLEDLALWTETAETNEVKSGGFLDSTGVFFGPNANFEMRSPATGSPKDAQFIGRRLTLLQGTLEMQPSPNNAVSIDLEGEFGLIR